MRKRIPDWYFGILVLIGAFWLGVSFYYHTGSSGVQFGAGGGALDFHRGSEFQLFHLSKRLAVYAGHDGLIRVVDYERDLFPLTLLCGTWDAAGNSLADARVSGDWVYGRPIQLVKQHGWHTLYRDGEAAVNVATGETVSVKKPDGDPEKDKNLPPELVARGLTAEAGAPINAAILKRLEPISTTSEGCTTFNTAFLILVALMGLLLPFLLLFRRRT